LLWAWPSHRVTLVWARPHARRLIRRFQSLCLTLESSVQPPDLTWNRAPTPSTVNPARTQAISLVVAASLGRLPLHFHFLRLLRGRWDWITPQDPPPCPFPRHTGRQISVQMSSLRTQMRQSLPPSLQPVHTIRQTPVNRPVSSCRPDTRRRPQGSVAGRVAHQKLPGISPPCPFPPFARLLRPLSLFSSAQRHHLRLGRGRRTVSPTQAKQTRKDSLCLTLCPLFPAPAPMGR